jgi:ribosomal protein S3
MKNLYNKVYNFLNPWKRNVKVSEAIFDHYTYIDQDQYYISKEKFFELHIINVTSRIEKGILNVRIELERPGALIGKGGKDIDLLQNYIEEELDCLVNIIIIESKLWKFYKY